ncbi:MAG: [NiFe]-hydrogenase assembly chaperone HybE, partial [Bauldia sp.]
MSRPRGSNAASAGTCSIRRRATRPARSRPGRCSRTCRPTGAVPSARERRPVSWFWRIEVVDPAAALARRLEAVFRRIERERMADVPILNPALKVEVVGMRPWAGDWLCVLVTPWSMNLMLLPGDSGEGGWRAQAVGSSTRLAFPAGGFDFIVGAEPGIGCFAMCSLFSPMDGFGENSEH